jgi:hypothetical protein
MSIEAMKQVVKEAVYHRGGYWIVPEKDFSSLCQAIAEAEKQEPVMGVEVKRSASGGFIGNVWWINESLKEGVFHLYTHPQQSTWVGLTDEEMRELEKQFNAERVRTSDEEYLVIYPADYWGWQRAIEAKLKEKNT